MASPLWRRALRLTQANLNDLRDRAASIGRSRSLDEMSDRELEAELERRRKEHAARAAVEEARRRAGGGDKGEREESVFEDDSEPPPARSRDTGKVALDLMDLSPQRRRQVRQYYANLELPFGADLDEVKQAYRRLMRQYHPDKHQGDPARRQLATQLSQKLTVAYNELSQLLKKAKKG